MSRQGGILCLDIATDTGWAYGLPGDPAPVWGVWRFPAHVSRGAAGAALEDELEKKLDEYQPCRLVFEAPLPANLQTNAASAFMLIGMAFATESCAHRCEVPVFSRSSDTFRNAVIGRSHLHDDEKRERPRPTVKTRIVAPRIAARGWKIPDHNAADAAVVWAYETGIRHAMFNKRRAAA